MTELPSFAIFFIGAAGALLLKGRALSSWAIAVPVISGLLLVLSDPAEQEVAISIAGLELAIFKPDRLSLVFGYVFHIAAIFGGIFSWRMTNPISKAAALIYAGSALGAVFCRDLISLFVFWELMAFSSAYLVICSGSAKAAQAGVRYLVIQIISGLLLLAGAVLHYSQTGSIEFTHMGLSGTAALLIFIAFGIKCAFPLLHNWLTDAYPESTPDGTVFLSAFTTKVAVYALARGFAGTESLIYIGALMTCFPIFYAVIENDLRRVLAYSMINQIGFMVCGIGIGTELAINGATAHAFNDVIFKGLMMMSMGAVLYRTGKMNGSDLGGLYKSMPKTAALCIVGAASISAFPLFSGFVSKSMVMSAALEEGYMIIWIALLFASAGVFHHAGIKIPFFAFFSHDSGIRVKEAPTSMLIAMGIAAFLCIGIGSFPQFLYGLLPYETNYTAYDTTHVLAQIQILLFSALAFVWLKLSGIYPPELRSVNIDVEWVYRKGLFAAYKTGAYIVQTLVLYGYSLLTGLAKNTFKGIARFTGRSSRLANERTVDLMIISVVVTFAVILVYHLFNL
ncbi:MAG: Na(+)/H(+) antiporter subunit D [Acidiferrobacterales bacterium]|nr:Na(+)/H(+) antiporter subunit D [Acidiferrobacterales bacterium]